MLRPGPLLAAATVAAAVLVPATAAQAAAPTLSPSFVGEDPNGPAVFRFPQAVGVSPDGQTIFVGDQYGGRIQAFDPLGRRKFSFGGRAARRENGRIGIVGGIAVDRSGHVFVADSENNRIQAFSATDGRFISSFGENDDLRLALATAKLDGGINAGGIGVHQRAPGKTVVVYVAASGRDRVLRYLLDPNTLKPYRPAKVSPNGLGLKRPQGVSVDPSGKKLFVPDNQNHRVQVLNPKTMRRIAVFGREGKGPGEFQSPYDVSIDARDPNQLYVADNLNGRVNVFDADTYEYIGTFGGEGRIVGKFSIVRALSSASDAPTGGLAVVDTSNDRIQVVNPKGAVTAAWGVAGRGAGYVVRPRGVAFAPDGGITVADTVDDRIEKFGPDGAFQSQLGPISTFSGYVKTDEDAGSYRLPEGVAYDADGRLWVADTGKRRVAAVDPQGTTQYVSDPGLFTAPSAVAVAPDGQVYVTDRNRGTLSRIPAGGGPPTVVRGGFTEPNAVTVDDDGRILVGDKGGVIDVATGGRIAAPGGGAWDGVTGLAVASDGTLYVSEQRPGTPNGARIVRGTPSAGGILGAPPDWDTVTTEGIGKGQVIQPRALALSKDGRTLAVADEGNDQILRFDAPGSVPPTLNRLTISIPSGSTVGKVRSQPLGIDCATDCGQGYARTQNVTLTAAPTSEGTFTGWSGACAPAGTAATCTVSMAQARLVGATFLAKPKPPVKLSRIGLSPRRLHLTRKKGKTLASRRATRAKLSVRVTQPSTGRLTVEASRRGRLVGGRCRALPARSKAKGSCVKYTKQPGTRRLRLIEGRTTFQLTPRVARRVLKPGLYRLTLKVTDSAGKTATRRSRSFRITK